MYLLQDLRRCRSLKGGSTPLGRCVECILYVHCAAMQADVSRLYPSWTCTVSYSDEAGDLSGFAPSWPCDGQRRNKDWNSLKLVRYLVRYFICAHYDETGGKVGILHDYWATATAPAMLLSCCLRLGQEGC